MKIHELKTWPIPFEEVLAGRKTHELRKNDRDFRVGDVLHLRKWDPETQKYPGDETMVTVTYITQGGSFGLPPALCVMSFRPGTPADTEREVRMCRNLLRQVDDLLEEHAKKHNVTFSRRDKE